MPNHRRRVAFFCLVLALAARAPLAQQTGSLSIDAAMSAPELDRALHTQLSKQTADDQFSGVVLVARTGVPVFQRAYGFADRANKRPNTLQTRFNLGSIYKAFTRSAIDQLVSQGRLAYTDTLGNILPDYPQPISQSATVGQLLNMTAGLHDLFGPEFFATAKDRLRSNADFYRFVSTQPPLFPPGSGMQHCNGCYIVLGAMIERLTQISYEQYVTENVFKPAGMASTATLQSDGIVQNVAIGYTRAGSDTLRSNVFLHGASGSAAGGGYSTAQDLLSYINATRNGRLPPAPPGMRIAGSAPGVSTFAQSDGTWTVIVLANLDPPTAEKVGVTIFDALTAKR